MDQDDPGHIKIGRRLVVVVPNGPTYFTEGCASGLCGRFAKPLCPVKRRREFESRSFLHIERDTTVSIKTTQRVTRDQAVQMVMDELADISNDELGELLDKLADTGRSRRLSKFDNFIVSDLPA